MTASHTTPSTPNTNIPPTNAAPTTPNSPASATCVGIDIGKAAFVTCLLPTRETRTWQNTAEGIAAAVAWLLGVVPQRIVLEATGGYERELLLAMLDAGLPAASVNPRQSHHARHALLKLDKTDHSDAEVLAWMAQHMDLEVTARPSENLLKLRDLVARRMQLVQMRTAEMNRRQMAKLRSEQKSIDRHVQFLEREIKKLAAEIAKLIEADEQWHKAAQLLQSVPGVGATTAHTLIAELPELGHASREQISALAGLAPRAKQSGMHDGPRHIYGGRAVVRTSAYMATLCAIRCNPMLKQTYIRLRKLGKLAKVAITACMRKLLIVLNSLLKTGQAWRNVLEMQSELAPVPGTPEKG